MNNYLALKEKLMSNFSKNISIQNMNKLEEKVQNLISKFTITSDQKEVDKLLKEKLINQYEEKKENVIFATLIEKLKNSFIVSFIIFDTDYTFSNLLAKEYDSLENATDYFTKLKRNIQTMDINSLSLYIIDNL